MSELQRIQLELIAQHARVITRKGRDLCLRLNLPDDRVGRPLSHTTVMEQLCQTAFGKSLNDLRKEASGQSHSEILPPIAQQGVPFRFRVGGGYWSVQAREAGALLRLDAAPAGVQLKAPPYREEAHREIWLGLGPVIRQDGPTGPFLLTMYGSNAILMLDFYQPYEVRELGRLAGVPVWNDESRIHGTRQQAESEAAFLDSVAFDFIRTWFRQGGHKHICPRQWHPYLCDVWPVLVAMSDEEFAAYRGHVVDRLVRRQSSTSDAEHAVIRMRSMNRVLAKEGRPSRSRAQAAFKSMRQGSSAA